MDSRQRKKGALRQGWTVCLFFFGLLLGSASAQNILIRAPELYAENDTVKANIRLDALFTNRILDAIESGMTTSIFLELRLESIRGIRLQERTLSIRLDHDIWEGQYRVVRYSSRPDTLYTADFESARRFCTSLNAVSIGPAQAVPLEQAVLKGRITVNPISPEQQQRTRKWLNLLEKGSILELFFSLDSPAEQTDWQEIKRFRLGDLP